MIHHVVCVASHCRLMGRPVPTWSGLWRLKFGPQWLCFHKTKKVFRSIELGINIGVIGEYREYEITGFLHDLETDLVVFEIQYCNMVLPSK